MYEGEFYGIGVGPGDPELLTLKAVKMLGRANVVVVPKSKQEGESIAYQVASQHIDKTAEVLSLLFPMTSDQGKLEKAWNEACDTILGQLEAGKNVAFLTIGDPMLYSTYIYMHKRIQKQGITVITVPGIPAFCAAAGAAGIPVAEGEEKVAIIPWKGPTSLSEQILNEFDNIVLMKVSRDFDRIREVLEKDNRLNSSVLVSKCGHEDEMISHDIAALRGEEIPYLSIMISKRKKDEE